MIDIFYKSYSKDFKWLKYSIESIKKFITGYNEVVIVIPRSDESLFDKSILDDVKSRLILVDEYGNGYLYQQWIKISAYKYCESDYILFCDSDSVFDKHTNLRDVILKKIEILYTDYSKVGDAICWKKITEKLLNREIEYEFMRRNFLIYKKETLLKISQQFPDLENYIMSSEGFSEFNAIGAWSYFYDNETYEFINTETAKPESLFSLGRQFWSYSNLTESELSEIKKILSKKMKITKEGFAVVERDTHLGKWVEETGRLDFDNNALGAYKHFFKENGVLLNVGANIGCYAYAFVNKAKKIICFEPNTEAFDCLSYNLSKYENIELHKQAISDREVGYTVISENDNVGMAFISEQEENSENSTTTIDSLNLQELDFILIDIEGLELKALNGGINTINRFKPIMVIEINDHTLRRFNLNRNQVFKWLTDNNYNYRNIYEQVGLDDEQLDIICFPKK